MGQRRFRVRSIPSIAGFERRAFLYRLAQFFRLRFGAVDADERAVETMGVKLRNIVDGNTRIENSKEFVLENELVSRFFLDGHRRVLCEQLH